MLASAINAALTYGALGDAPGLGLATGIAVDIGLCVALIGDRQLYAHGVRSGWGRALRVTTATMALALNVGIPLRAGHYYAALLHSFLPVLLVVLCEYGADVLLTFTALDQKTNNTQGPEPAPIVAPPSNPYPTPPPTPTPAATPPSAPGPRPTPAPVAAASPALTLLRPPAPTKPCGVDAELVARARDLVAGSARPLGRRELARRLGVSEHTARLILTHVTPTSSGRARARTHK
jgi:hypothetical protein